MMDPEDAVPVPPESPFERYLKGKDPAPPALAQYVADRLLSSADKILKNESEPLHLRSIRAFLFLIDPSGNEMEETETKNQSVEPEPPVEQIREVGVPEESREVPLENPPVSGASGERSVSSPSCPTEVPKGTSSHALQHTSPVEISEDKYQDDLVLDVLASAGQDDGKKEK